MGQGYKNFLTSCLLAKGKDKLKVFAFTVTVLKIVSLYSVVDTSKGGESGAVSGFKVLG